jgi:IrrE N-terminal-like domain
MTDDYRVISRSDQEVRRLAKKLRAYFGIADCSRVDVVACVKQPNIWTVRGVQRLNFQARPDSEMGGDHGSTTYGKGIVNIAIKQSVFDAAVVGDGRCRNTFAHELGHGAMHDGPPLFRRAMGNVSPAYLKPYESAEHQAKVFAPAFLINDSVAATLASAEEISIEFGISLESALIYWEALINDRERAKNAARIRGLAAQLAADFRASDPLNTSKMRYLQEFCTVCREQKVFPIGVKFMCDGCGTVFDRFQDGDP